MQLLEYGVRFGLLHFQHLYPYEDEEVGREYDSVGRGRTRGPAVVVAVAAVVDAVVSRSRRPQCPQSHWPQWWMQLLECGARFCEEEDEEVTKC